MKFKGVNVAVVVVVVVDPLHFPTKQVFNDTRETDYHANCGFKVRAIVSSKQMIVTSKLLSFSDVITENTFFGCNEFLVNETQLKVC